MCDNKRSENRRYDNHVNKLVKRAEAVARCSTCGMAGVLVGSVHEAGSRFIEAGMPLHHVREMLGHASLEQTSTQLNMTSVGSQESMRRFDEAGARCEPVANGTECAVTCGPENGADRTNPLLQ